MMKLYSDFGESEGESGETEATLSDLKAALAEHGLVAVPVEPTEAMYLAYSEGQACTGFDEGFAAMIKAAQA